MEKISFAHLKNPQKKQTTFRFQETCLNLAKLSGLAPGVLFALWKKVGPEIYQIESEHRQGEIKKLKVYLLWRLKNNKIK